MTRRRGILLALLALPGVAVLGVIAGGRYSAASRDWDDLTSRFAAQQFDSGAARCVTLVLSPAHRQSQGVQDVFEPAEWARLLTLPADEITRGCQCVGAGMAADTRAFFDDRARAKWMLHRIWAPLGSDVAPRLLQANEEWRTAGSGAALRRRLQTCLAPPRC